MFIRPFSTLRSTDAAIAGGKGASLGEMTQSGIPVPPGCVVVAAAFEDFIDANSLRAEIIDMLTSVDHNSVGSIESASERIQELILQGNISPEVQSEIKKYIDTLEGDFFAIRSSATAEDGAEHAWAGQLDTYLNVSKDDIEQKIQSCWSSLFTPRALFYRSEKGLRDLHISVAVVVQSMVDAESAGVAFSVHPVTENHDEIVIEGSYGLGEAVVSGEVTPDSFVVSKSSAQILSRHISEKKKGLFRSKHGDNEWREIAADDQEVPIFSDQKIAELSKMIIKIENHYGFPCDIEWAFADDQFFILQARPITTLKSTENKKYVLLMTRQMNIMSVESLDKGFFLENSMHFGVDFPRSFYCISRDNLVEIWREESNLRTLPNKIAKAIKDQGNEIIENAIKKIRNSIESLNEIKKKIIEDNFENEEIVSLIGEIDIIFSRGFPGLIAIDRIPQWSEHDADLFSKDLIQNCIEARKKYENFFPLGVEVFQMLLQKISQIIGAEELSLMDMNQRSAKEILVSGNDVSEKKKKQHDQIFFYDGKLLYGNLPEILKNLKLELKKDIIHSPKGTIKGQIGYPGKVQGRVKIVRYENDYKDIKQEKILVTAMTNPAIVPYMNKVLAIITDEGGITCHAAIIARELQKPCIIGTKNATKVLKDGDLVEVDADSGAIRILERKNNPEITILTESFTREFPLIQIQMWGRRYTEEFLGKVLKKLPIYLFKYKDGLVTAYRSHENQKAIINPIIRKRLDDDSKFLEKYFEQQMVNAENLEMLLLRECTNIGDFQDYLQGLFDFWQLHYIAQFLPLDLKFFTEYERSYALFIRAQIDKKIHFLWKGINTFCEKLYPELNDLVHWLTWDEIKAGDIPQVSELENRKRTGVILLNDIVVDEKELCDLQLKNNFQIQENEIDESITGEIASPGIIKGIVKKVIKKSDVKYFRSGEIFVSYMTMPDFQSAYSQSSAIITDEGGITSHASIVAREMNKPCIIGTKNATKVLKDGDLVEVDADSGVVRILEKQKKYNPDDYLLSFWAQGVSIFITDIHREIYQDLEVLYIIDRGMFKQYFTKNAYEKRLQEGLKFYKRREQFISYKKSLTEHCEVFRHFFLTEIHEKKSISRETIETFFSYTKTLCGDYTKMNFEYTDLAFMHRDDDPIIHENLGEVSVFKDQIRSFMNTVLFEPGGFCDEVFEILSGQFQSPKTTLERLMQSEILDMYLGVNFDPQKIQQRQKVFVQSYEGVGCLEPEQARKIIQEFQEKITESDRVCGQVASSGNTIGKVKIIAVDYRNLERINQIIDSMQEGDILVAETTAPELMLACKKAGAIVTDMGGMMSHAAIVSREFGIPCVVGTGNATKILKDGDLVEVDAESGIVRILEKA